MTPQEKFWAKVDRGPPDQCWVWKGFMWGTYGGFRAPEGNVLAHRMAYSLSKGSIPTGMMVLHACDNRLCCNPSHLSVGTAKDNAWDCTSRGRHSARKHDELTVMSVRKLVLFGISKTEIGSILGVHPDIVARMANDPNAWKHVPHPQVTSCFVRHQSLILKGHYARKLQAADVPSMRSLRGQRFAREVGKDYGVSENAILQVWRGNSWRNVQ